MSDDKRKYQSYDDDDIDDDIYDDDNDLYDEDDPDDMIDDDIYDEDDPDEDDPDDMDMDDTSDYDPDDAVSSEDLDEDGDMLDDDIPDEDMPDDDMSDEPDVEPDSDGQTEPDIESDGSEDIDIDNIYDPELDDVSEQTESVKEETLDVSSVSYRSNDDPIEFIQIDESSECKTLEYLQKSERQIVMKYLKPEYEDYSAIMFQTIKFTYNDIKRDYKTKFFKAPELEELKHLLVDNIKNGEEADDFTLVKLDRYKNSDDSVIVNAGLMIGKDFVISLNDMESHIFGINAYMMPSDDEDNDYIEYGISDINGSRFVTVNASKELVGWFRAKIEGLKKE